MKLLLVGHACSPRRGSELAGTWNWAWHLSQKHQVWALTHPQEQEHIEAFLSLHRNPNLHFVWVTVPRWLDSWNPADPDSRVGLRHYLLWQRIALRKAEQLHSGIGFDLVHHVSWGTLSVPPPFWRLPMPFVWGPVGGGQVCPAAFRGYLGSAAKTEKIRDARTLLTPLRPMLRRAARSAAMIFATNHETAGILHRAGTSRLKLFLDSGIREDFLPKQVPQRVPGAQFTLLWAGRLIPRKCLPLALEALMQNMNIPARLLVAGQGPMLREWQSLAQRLGLSSRVEFLGQVPYRQMPTLYRSADMFIFTSLRDSFGSQVLEAMASGLPVVTLDHQGTGAFVPREAGVKVPVTNPQETLSGLAAAIRYIAGSEQARSGMGKAAWQFAQTQTWKRRAEAMCHHYEDALERYRGVPHRDREVQAGLHVSRVNEAPVSNGNENAFQIPYKS